MTERPTRDSNQTEAFLDPAGQPGTGEHRPDRRDDAIAHGARGRDRSVQRRRAAERARAAETSRDRFGGVNVGAAFFGWLVAVALSVLLAGIVGAAAAAVGETLDLTRSDAEREAGALGLAAGIALLVVLMIGYYAGGYVSGRMSRFDGARQGWAVWLIGVVVAAFVALAGWIFGSEYDIFQRVDLPSVPLADDTLTAGGVILAAAVVLGTLLAALAGGKLGLRYHHKVDRHTP
jgi:hypothetical protein